MTASSEPDSAAAWVRSGILAANRGAAGDATDCFRAALRKSPDDFDAHLSLGVVSLGKGDTATALDGFSAAVKLRPDSSEAHRRLGETFRFLNRLDEAIFHIQRALDINPDDEKALAQLVYSRMRACDWNGLAQQKQALKEATDEAIKHSRVPPLRPFVAVVAYTDGAFAYRVAEAHSSAIAQHLSEDSLSSKSKRRRDRIRLGYLSAGFGRHPTSHLTRNMFAAHDRKRFQIVGLALNRDDDTEYRHQIVDSCDDFIDLSALSDHEAANRIQDAEIDILVDLHGYLQNNRIRIAAQRPAPVQVSYLGFPGTTGARFFDYLIGDGFVTPLDHAGHFSEKLVLLPNTYQVNDSSPPISHQPFTRYGCGLPSEGVVFSCFNVSYKIDVTIFGAWMRILRAVPGSVLWLLKTGSAAERNLRREAMARGVDPKRLIFADFAEKPDHLARMGLVDIALDTSICNGHTTTTDNLWAGVPVITLRGTHFASRVATSLLAAAGLMNLVAANLDAYVGLATHYASDPSHLVRLKERLRGIHLTTLFDLPRFVRGLEAGYEKMWNLYQDGQPTRHIVIEESLSSATLAPDRITS